MISVLFDLDHESNAQSFYMFLGLRQYSCHFKAFLQERNCFLYLKTLSLLSMF